MTEIQMMTLKDVFRQVSMEEDRIEEIIKLLLKKPEIIQTAFYLRACGHPFREIGELIGKSKTQVERYIHEECADIEKYLLLFCEILQN